MNKLNNKAQTLVAFILLLPLICLIVVIFLEKLYLYSEKENLKSTANLICTKAIKEYNPEKLEELALKNDKKITDFKINKLDTEITVELTKEMKIITNSYTINQTITCK